MSIAAYDAIADWYDEYVRAGTDYAERIHAMLAGLLGPATGPAAGQTCVDLCCGTGARAQTLLRLGWRPFGVDISAGQLRYARAKMPVAQADATALPIGGEAVQAAVCVLAHTDVPDYRPVVGEAARILKPGGVFVHVGIHPAFVGAFADRSDPARVLIDASYHRRDRRFDSFGPQGVRVRVGAWHTSLPQLLHTALDAGLTLTRVVEDGRSGQIPEIFGFSARKP
jgi:ubiquinone/menaquinone biosynthesis C-methylase UbiE